MVEECRDVRGYGLGGVQGVWGVGLECGWVRGWLECRGVRGHGLGGVTGVRGVQGAGRAEVECGSCTCGVQGVTGGAGSAEGAGPRSTEKTVKSGANCF